MTESSGRSPPPPSKTRMLPTIGQRRSPDAKNLFTMSKNHSRQPTAVGLQPAAAGPRQRQNHTNPQSRSHRASLRLTASEFSLAACHSRHPAFAARTAQTGGADRNRTDDLLRAKQALSQLSYGPLSEDRGQKTDDRKWARFCRLSSVLRPWWAWVDLNYRPHAYQACALTN
jgi:hypothetical protein